MTESRIFGALTLLLAPLVLPAAQDDLLVRALETDLKRLGDAKSEVDSLVAQGMSRMDAIKAVARRRGLSKREVYQQLENSKPQ